jgi:hypothetical protein
MKIRKYVGRKAVAVARDGFSIHPMQGLGYNKLLGFQLQIISQLSKSSYFCRAALAGFLESVVPSFV